MEERFGDDASAAGKMGNTMMPRWPRHAKLRRAVVACDRFCAAALPHLQMTVVYLSGVLFMQIAPLIGSVYFGIH